MNKIVKRIIIAVTSLTLIGGLTACDWSDKVTEPFKDAPRSGRTFEGPADVITMPDGFSNLATKCGPGQNRYTVVYHGDSLYGSVTVVKDETCPRQ